jgi:hypothetical protein
MNRLLPHAPLLPLLALLLLAGAAPRPRPLPNPDPLPLGLGLVQVHPSPDRPLYFYALAPADVEGHPDAAAPADSLTFRQGEHHVEIATAPPWFVPEVLKLDYDVLFLRTVTLAHDWVEVVVNTSAELPRMTPRTMWVRREAVAFRPWVAFLLDVAAVEPLDLEANPVRTGPDDGAAVLSEAWVPVRPLAVQGDWLLVSTLGLADRIPPAGWLRWRSGDRLLVAYAILS